MARGTIIVVQGGQWGSEAKGLITHKLTIERKPKWAVRTGTVNAGHTVYHNELAFPMQQLPVSWVDPEVNLVIGAGAYINPAILGRELGWINTATGQDPLYRLYIDYRCGLHTQDHTDRSTLSGRHHSIGATGKGCSEAVMDKIRDRDKFGRLPLFSEWVKTAPAWQAVGSRLCDTTTLLNSAYDDGDTILVEGTQGTLLDLHLGDYPYVTHKQCQAANWLAECGLSPALHVEIWGVYRTYPIRVAGNSGPFPGEISWSTLARRIRRDALESDGPTESGCAPIINSGTLHRWEETLRLVHAEHYPASPSPEPGNWSPTDRYRHQEAASEIHAKALELLEDSDKAELRRLFEFTTVTHKLRRVGEWNWQTFQRSVTMNRPHKIALTFMNYKFPYMWGLEEPKMGAIIGGHQSELAQFVKRVEECSGAKVDILSFGPQIENTFYLPKRTMAVE